MQEPKVKIGSKYRENIETVKGLVKLVVGNSSLRDFVHVYINNDKGKKIIVEPTQRNIKVHIYYKTGLIKRESYAISYSALEN